MSRIPFSYTLATKLVQRAWADNEWNDLGRSAQNKYASEYQLQGYNRDFYGRLHRFIVFHPSGLRRQKEVTMRRRLDREQTNWEKKLVKRTTNPESSKRHAGFGIYFVRCRRYLCLIRKIVDIIENYRYERLPKVK